MCHVWSCEGFTRLLQDTEKVGQKAGIWQSRLTAGLLDKQETVTEIDLLEELLINANEGQKAK